MEAAIAIIGMAGRFPGADCLDTLWVNLCDGIDSTATPLAGLDRFDADFFGYTRREAEIMDPQHRLFLETAWEALEHAGYDIDRCRRSIGVFGGASTTAYLSNILSNLDGGASIRDANLGLGNELSFLTTRVSYKLDLQGPSFPVQAAGSGSLVAIHLASQSLLNFECDTALAGGVAFKAAPESGDATFTNGVGVVVLKRFPDATRDRDTIYAVIRGSAVNHDGETTPSARRRAAVIAEAQAQGGVDARSISYVELHDAGPIEMRALAQVFDRRAAPVAMGSVRPNVGNLDAAAGVAGLLKTVLALRHHTIPPTLSTHDRLDWTSGNGPRRAGVNAFGSGGTNVHLVLEEGPPTPTASPTRPSQLLLLSARNPQALDQMTERLSAFLRWERPSLADTAYTLAVGRRQFAHRRAIIATDILDAASALEQPDPGATHDGTAGSPPPAVAFSFPDGDFPTADSWPPPESEPVFRAAAQSCLELRPDQAHRPELRRFATQYALAQLWLSWGVKPGSTSGQGVGELVAAVVARELTLESAIDLVVAPTPRQARPPVTTALNISMVPGEPLADPQLTLARLWVAGVEVDWAAYFSGEQRRRIALPTYPFQRQRYWLPRREAPPPQPHRPPDHELIRTDDHAVYVARLAPGEASHDDTCLELARTAGSRYFDQPVTILDGTEILAELTTDTEEVTTVHVVMTATAPDRATFKVVARSSNLPGKSRSHGSAEGLLPGKLPDLEASHDDGGGWILHVRGELAVETAPQDIELSHAQQGFWLMHRLDGAGMELHLPVWQFVERQVDGPTLERAVNYLIARHDALRTVIRATAAGPRQSALERHTIEVPLVDLRDRADPQAEAQALITQDNARPFDLGRPLIRAGLYRLADEKACIYLNTHHIVADGISAGLLLRELQAVYEAMATGQTPSLPHLPQTFLGHVRAEHRWLESEEAQRMRAYWTRELREPLPRLELADLARPPGGATGFHDFGIDSPTAQRLRACAQQLRVTMNTLLLSAYLAALHLMTGASDLIVGLPFGGRGTKDLEGVFGLFVNTLSIRAEVGPATVFADLAQRVGEKSVAAYHNSRFPFGLLVEQLNPRRESGRNPVFSTAFQYADFLPPTYQTAGLDAGLYGQPGPDGIEMRLSYSTARLSESRVRALVTAFLQVIDEAATDRGVVVGSLGRPAPAQPAQRQSLQARLSARRNT